MTKPEKQVKEILESLGFASKPFKQKQKYDLANVFYEQYPVKSLFIDFALPRSKVAIEVNGNYWHGINVGSMNYRQLQRKITDNQRTDFLQKNDWKLIHISENQLTGKTISQNIYQRILSCLDV